MTLLKNVYRAQYEDGRNAEVQVVIQRKVDDGTPCVEISINEEDIVVENSIIHYATDEVADQGFHSLNEHVDFLCKGMLPHSEKLINFQLQ